MTEQNVGGRPTKYEVKFNKQAYRLALLGCTDAEMAAILDVSESTFNLWKLTYKRFSESIAKGKSEADAKVAEALYKRACGYSHKAVKFATFEGQITDSQEYIEHYAPDTNAASLWLRNRQPKKWRDKPEVENGNNGGLTLDSIVANQHAITKLLMPEEGTK